MAIYPHRNTVKYILANLYLSVQTNTELNIIIITYKLCIVEVLLIGQEVGLKVCESNYLGHSDYIYLYKH